MKLNKFQICSIAVLICFVGVSAVPVADANPGTGSLVNGGKKIVKPVVEVVKKVVEVVGTGAKKVVEVVGTGAKKVVKSVAKFFHRGEIKAFHKSLENVIQKLKDNPRLSGPVRFGMDLVTFEVVDKVIVMKLINGNSMSYEVKFQPNDDDQNVDCYVNDILIGFIPYQISQDFQTISDEYIPDALHDMANGVIKIYQKRYETAYNQ